MPAWIFDECREGAVRQWRTVSTGSERQWRSFRTDRNGVQTRSGAETKAPAPWGAARLIPPLLAAGSLISRG